MKYKIIIAICCALICCLITGCQLAQVDAGQSAPEDSFVGFFVTTEYLDLFDFEGYLNDNIAGFSGGEIIVDGDNHKYQGRVYATLTTRTLTNVETGETIETEEYVFESLDGMAYFTPTVPATAESDSYVSSMSDEAINDGHMSVNYADDKTSTTLEATIYAAPTGMNHTYYFNPVFQSADGSVYLTAGSGFMVYNEPISEGSVYSQSMESTTTITENGQSKAKSMSVTLAISVMYAPQRIVILQMDSASRLLSHTQYAPGELPEVFAPQAGTDYIIVETHKRDQEGKQLISREIFGQEDTALETFFTRADGICVKRQTQIEWE